MEFARAKGLVQSRWMMLVASFFIMSCAGALYSYSIYSGKLKTVLKYDQETVTTIGFFKDLGANIGVMAGIIYDFTGAWPVLLLGAIFNVFGYVMTWLSLSQRIARPEVWQMCLYLWVGASSGAFVSTAVIVTCVKNFPRNRGIVIGLLKGFVGLSGAMLTQVYRAIYGDNPISFLLVVAWFPASMFLLFMFYIRPLPAHKEKNELKKFYVFLGTSLVLAFFLLAVILAQNLAKVDRPTNIALMAIMILILALPVVVVFQSESEKWKQIGLGSPEETQIRHSQKSEVTNGDKPCLLVPKDENAEEKIGSTELGTDLGIDRENHASDSETVQKSTTMKKLVLKFYKELRYRAKRGEDYTILQALTSLDMWIIFLATTAGLGSGLMAIDNLGQIGSSLGYSHSQVTTFQSLLSIWNFFGRVGFGFVSEIAMQRFGVPRPFFLTLILGIMSVGHLYLAFALPGALYFGSVIVGMCFGGTMSVVFAIISEIFGLKYFGTLYNVGILASPLGTYLLSVRVAGTLYDNEARKQVGNAGLSKSELVCTGSICYKNTFIIMAACCIFGCIISLILTLMTMKFYKTFRPKPSDPEDDYCAALQDSKP